MWLGFVIGFIVGLAGGFTGCSLATLGKQRDYEDKLWELERMKMQYESREQ